MVLVLWDLRSGELIMGENEYPEVCFLHKFPVTYEVCDYRGAVSALRKESRLLHTAGDAYLAS